MGAAAELIRNRVLRVNGYSPNFCAVFFTKQRHGSFGHRLLAWFDLDADGVIRQDLSVHISFDLVQNPKWNGFGMGEVKAQPVWRHQRASLPGM